VTSPHIVVIIPAYNEAQSIGLVIQDIPKQLNARVIVADNNSSDDTGIIARKAGADVVIETKRGYGNACLAGLAFVKHQNLVPDIVVFLDGDYSDYPEEMMLLIEPIVADKADLVIGSRAMGKRESGSMTPPQIFGNWLATRMLKLLYGVRFTDLGPFRAIRYTSLQKIGMKDQTYGWTVEMQLKAARMRLRCMELPVRYRKRIGESKISGTVKGTILAGYKILFTIFRYL